MASIDEDQLACATAPIDRPLLIVAGPGSGKTRTLCHRIFHMVGEKKIPPNQVLGLTFTRKSAESMRQRVRRELVGHQLEDSADKIVLKTLHSWSLSVLRRFCDDAGLPHGFRVADQRKQKEYARMVVQRDSRGRKDAESVQALIRRINFIKSYEDGESKLGVNNNSNSFDYLFRPYQTLLAEQQCIDFGDIMLRTLKLLRENALVLQVLNQRHSYILVDEFQDLSAVQLEMLCLLGQHGHITCVGDPDQCIYGWRGSLAGIFTTFAQRFPNTTQKRLKWNYRSALPIVQCCSKLSAAGEQEALTSGPKVSVMEYATSHLELKGIGDVIQQLVSEGKRRYRDFGVLTRTRQNCHVVLAALEEMRVPVVRGDPVDLSANAIVRALIGFLRLTVDPNDAASLGDILMIAAIRPPKSTIPTLVAEATRSQRSMLDVARSATEAPRASCINNKKARDCLSSVVAVVGEARRQLDSGRSTRDIVLAIIEYAKLREAVQRVAEYSRPHHGSDLREGVVESDDEVAEMPHNPDKLFEPVLAVCSQLESAKHPGGELGLEFLADELSNLVNSDDFAAIKAEKSTEAEVSKTVDQGTPVVVASAAQLLGGTPPFRAVEVEEDLPQDCVSVSTVHAAKGLEWRCVIIHLAVPGQFPIYPNSSHKALDEERRVMFVAMSRAQEQLFITTLIEDPSPYVLKLPQQHTEHLVVPLTTHS